MNVNIFLILTQTAVNTLRGLMDDRQYNGQHIKAVRIFRRMADYVIVENMWRKPTIGGKKRHLFSVTLSGNAKAKVAIDYLLVTYPNQIAVGGAWFWDGRQVGTRWNANKTATTGTPAYPIPSQLVKFMPTLVLADVNLEQDMKPRRFT